MSMIAISGRVSERDAQLVKAIVAGIMPDVHARFEELEAENKSLVARIAELEARKPEPGPPGEKGEKGDTGEAGKDGRDGTDGKDGRDAAGIVDGLKHEGELVLTLADGRLVKTGIRDGAKGEDGKDGRDGFELEDFDMDRGEDGRSYILSFKRGEYRHEYEWKLPTPAYCGIYKADQEYEPGDFVTWGNCLWHCDEPTKEKPDAGPWTMAMKRPRDGKDAKPNG